MVLSLAQQKLAEKEMTTGIKDKEAEKNQMPKEEEIQHSTEVMMHSLHS
jgi:hypothetical protein